jgi:hypothetical protein
MPAVKPKTLEKLDMAKPLVRTRNTYLFFIFTVFLVGLVGAWHFGAKYIATRTALAESAIMIRDIDVIQRETSALRDQTIAQFEENRQLLEDTAFKILPPDENLIELTRSLDDFFDRNFVQGNEILANNLRFGTPKQSEDGLYSMLPVSMSIESTRDKFNLFLNYVENTGSFQDGTRILDIRSVRMNFSGEDSSRINFTVDLNAYFRAVELSNNSGEIEAQISN